MEKCPVIVCWIVVVDIFFGGAVGYTLISVTSCYNPQLAFTFFTANSFEEIKFETIILVPGL